MKFSTEGDVQEVITVYKQGDSDGQPRHIWTGFKWGASGMLAFLVLTAFLFHNAGLWQFTRPPAENSAVPGSPPPVSTGPIGEPLNSGRPAPRLPSVPVPSNPGQPRRPLPSDSINRSIRPTDPGMPRE